MNRLGTARGVGFLFAGAAVAVFACLFPVPVAGGERLEKQWVARYNGPSNGRDEVSRMALDPASGKVCVTGSSEGIGSFRDYATTCYDSTGNEIWTARYNGWLNGEDVALAVAVDPPTGRVYVTGWSDCGSFSPEHATIAYDVSGNQLWVDTPSGGQMHGGSQFNAIAVNFSGDVYVTGLDRPWITPVYWTRAYDPSGVGLWDAQYQGPGPYFSSGSWAQAIAVDAFGNGFVTGCSVGDGTDLDFATIAYDLSGATLWVARYNGPGNGEDRAEAIAIDPSGRIYVTGRSYGGDLTNYDYATVAYDSSGTGLWVATYDGPDRGDDRAWDIACDPSNGNVYVTGQSQGQGEVLPDYLTVAYDESGRELWTARYDGPAAGFDAARRIAVDSFGRIYVTGESLGSGTDLDYATIAYDRSGNELAVARFDGRANGMDGAKDIAADSLGCVYVTGTSEGAGTGPDYATIKYCWVSDEDEDEDEDQDEAGDEDHDNDAAIGVRLRRNLLAPPTPCSRSTAAVSASRQQSFSVSR
jgi:hypothetical protein